MLRKKCATFVHSLLILILFAAVHGAGAVSASALSQTAGQAVEASGSVIWVWLFALLLLGVTLFRWFRPGNRRRE